MKAILQLREPLKVGGADYYQLVGNVDYNSDDKIVSAGVSFLNAILILKEQDIFLTLLLSDDADLSDFVSRDCLRIN